MIAQTLHRHLTLSFRMLLDVVEKCPDDLWIGKGEGDSVWKRVFHVLESLDYWLDDFSDYLFPRMFNGFSAEMDADNASPLTKDRLSEYANFIERKIDDCFAALTGKLVTEESKKHPKSTYADIILSQIRHIQVNIGYCNEKMISAGRNGVAWIGYGEDFSN